MFRFIGCCTTTLVYKGWLKCLWMSVTSHVAHVCAYVACFHNASTSRKNIKRSSQKFYEEHTHTAGKSSLCWLAKVMAPSGCKVAIWMFGWAEERFCISHTKSANEMTRNVCRFAIHNIHGFFLVGKWWKQWYCGDSGSCSAIGHAEQETTQWPHTIQLNSTINQWTAFYSTDYFLPMIVFGLMQYQDWNFK